MTLRKFQTQLARYKDLFPLGLPKLELQGLVAGIASVHINRQFMREFNMAPLEAAMAFEISSCCDHVFAAMVSSPPTALSLINSVPSLVKLLNEDKCHFAPTFKPYVMTFMISFFISLLQSSQSARYHRAKVPLPLYPGSCTVPGDLVEQHSTDLRQRTDRD